MRTFIIAIMSAIALTTAAIAGEAEVMASRYGNTTKVTMADGTVVKIWYNADHTWTGDNNGNAINGTWKVADGKLCVTFANPPPNVTNPTCSEAKARTVGETWTAGEGDQKMTVTLVQGKQ